MPELATKTCCARIGYGNMRLGAPRRGDRCGSIARETAILGTAGEPIVELHLCGLHAAVLTRSPNPHALAERWLP